MALSSQLSASPQSLPVVRIAEGEPTVPEFVRAIAHSLSCRPLLAALHHALHPALLAQEAA